MEMIGPDLSLWVWLFAAGVAILAGLIKGMVGFAMPMVMISGLASVMSPELALAGLILPTLVTNFWQAFREGLRAAWTAVVRYRVFLSAGGVVIVLSAQLVRVIPPQVMLLAIGLPIILFAAAGLAGKPLRLAPNPGIRAEATIGAVAGFFGGISGVWGPPTVAMLTARNTPKAEQMRVQGVIYGLGAFALVGAHLGSGVLRWETLPLSLAMVPPAIAGMLVGMRINDRIDQKSFRLLTLAVLLVAGLNLVRRAVFGG